MADQFNDGENSGKRPQDEDELFPKDSMDITDQIGRSLEKYSPFLLKELKGTLEGAMNDHIAQTIREEVVIAVQDEFEKRFGNDKDTDKEKGEEGEKDGKKFNYRNFSYCNPPSYGGDPSPIVSTRWVSEIEGAFRTCECPERLKVTYGVSMLKDRAKRWWDAMLVKKDKDWAAIKWEEFKLVFFKEFRSEAEVTRLRSEFLNDSQGALTVHEFRNNFLDKAQFCPEFLESDLLLKEQFHRKLRKSLNEKISLTQIEDFAKLVSVARDHEIGMQEEDEGGNKRKMKESNSPNKRFKYSGGGSSGGVARKGIPFCNQCKKNHSGTCRLGRGCFTCGKPGHHSQDCKAVAPKPLTCFKCFKEGHMRMNCPTLTEDERREERRKEAERRNALQGGNVRGRSFQLTVEKAKTTDDVVTGTFLVFGTPMRILFDSGANRSFVATRVLHVIPRMLSRLEFPLIVEVGNGKVENVSNVYKDCEIEVNSEIFLANLIPFPMGEFDVILGMDWLSSYQAQIVCGDKAIHLKAPSGESVVIYGDRKDQTISLCTFARARRHISHGCLAYLIHVVDV